jgi:hypothetical protein
MCAGIWHNWCPEQRHRKNLGGGHQPSQIVRLPLPKLAAVALNKNINREPSGNLLALLFGDDAQTEDVLHEYGRFLRSGGATSDTPSSYSARIAYSFGAVVRQVSGNKVLAALASLDLRLSAPAELDYLCIREDAISNAVSGAFSYLGFGECVETPDPRYVGSPSARSLKSLETLSSRSATK